MFVCLITLNWHQKACSYDKLKFSEPCADRVENRMINWSDTKVHVSYWKRTRVIICIYRNTQAIFDIEKLLASFQNILVAIYIDWLINPFECFVQYRRQYSNIAQNRNAGQEYNTLLLHLIPRDPIDSFTHYLDCYAVGYTIKLLP